MEQRQIPFAEMFPCCMGADEALRSGLDTALVRACTLDKATASLHLEVEFKTVPAPVVRSIAESNIAKELDLDRVDIRPCLHPPPEKKQGQKSTG